MNESVKNKSAVLVGVARSSRELTACERSLDELAQRYRQRRRADAHMRRKLLLRADFLFAGKVEEQHVLCRVNAECLDAAVAHRVVNAKHVS